METKIEERMNKLESLVAPELRDYTYLNKEGGSVSIKLASTSEAESTTIINLIKKYSESFYGFIPNNISEKITEYIIPLRLKHPEGIVSFVNEYITILKLRSLI